MGSEQGHKVKAATCAVVDTGMFYSDELYVWVHCPVINFFIILCLPTPSFHTNCNLRLYQSFCVDSIHWFKNIPHWTIHNPFQTFFYKPLFVIADEHVFQLKLHGDFNGNDQNI